ncbi:hypothetical protein JCM11641_003345 [Rhodosporidiobolus odoratus]
MPSKGKSSSKPAPPPPPPTATPAKPLRKGPRNIVKSGNAGANKPEPKPLAPGETPPPPPLFPIGYKTPLNLLSERCQKNGWERPDVQPRKGTLPNSWTASVALRRKHPKTNEMKTVFMRPPPPPSAIAVEKTNAMEAKHWAAVYALFRVANNLRLNMQLPPQTRDYWAALEAEKAASTPNKQWLWSTTPFETAAAAPPPPSSSPPSTQTSSSRAPSTASASSCRAGTPSSSSLALNRSQGPPPLPKSWLEAPEVRMPTALRDLVERTIRDSLPDLENEMNCAGSGGGGDDHAASSHSHGNHGDGSTPFSPQEQALQAEFLSLGFRPGHVFRALAYSRTSASNARLNPATLRHDLLTNLHLLVPESDLPPAFREARPADATIRNATSHDSEALGRMWRAERVAMEIGVGVEWVEREFRELSAVAGEGQEGDVEGATVDVLVRRLVSADETGQEEGEREKLGEEEWRKWFRQAEGAKEFSTEEKEELMQRRDDELLALEGLFGSRFVRTKEGVEIAIPTTTNGVGRGKASAAIEALSLRVLFHPSSRYPSPSAPGEPAHLPTFYLSSTSLPPYIRLHLLTLLSSSFLPSSPSSENGGTWLDLVEGGYGGVVAEMVAFLEEHARGVIDNPPDAREVLDRLRSPSERASASLASNLAGQRMTKSASSGPQRGGGRKRREPTPEEHVALKRQFEELQRTEGYQRMLEQRKRLPAWGMKERIVELIRKERVVIVCGETGSGKTTQVPAFVLEDAILRSTGASTSLVITQPRRVSAIGVSSRVAAERCEALSPGSQPSPNNLVGYAIRGERRAAQGCRALFCTTGVVLARLGRGGDPDLQSVSHIFIDEVHERSVDSDFLLLELREILQRNPKIKIILMSATINQKQFSDYFGGAPVIEIPGFTHPVVDHYLEAYLPRLLASKAYRPTGKPARKATQVQLDRMRESYIARGVDEGDVRGLAALELATRAEKIDFGLVGATVAYCLEQSRDVEGDILVFMTGVLEIKRSIEAIAAAVPSSQSSSLLILPLHANLTSQEQTAVFRPTPAGKRKIVVATNVAETSITIDGIVYVVDCGRVKENAFDAESGITRLVEQWTSRAGCRQRRGRAGRTRPGVCYKLFTQYTEDVHMNPQPTPEIQRTPLEALLLQIKSTRPTANVRDYLSKALDPPNVKAIEGSWATLRLLGAVVAEGAGAEGDGLSARLTPLGMHLAMIPVDVRLAKMLVLAAIFRCLNPILTIVAILSSKPFFNNPMEKRDEAKKARAKFYTGKSDLLSDARAFEATLAARKDGNAALRSFTEDNFISSSTFRDILSLRTDYLSALSSVGFIPLRATASDPAFNENSQNENLLKAIIFAGTARLIRVKMPKAVYDKGISGAIERERESREVKYFEPEGRVFPHPASLLFEETKLATPYCTYFNKQVTTKPFLRDVNEVPLYALLLFSPVRISMDLDRGVTIHLGARSEQWVHLRAWPRIGVLVNGLRRLFDKELEGELEEPGFGGALLSSFLLNTLTLSFGGPLPPVRSCTPGIMLIRIPTRAGPASPAVQAMLELISGDGGLR